MNRYTRLKLGLLAMAAALLLMVAGCDTAPYMDGIKKDSDLKEMGLEGPVKSLRVRKYRISRNRNTGEIINYGLSKSDARNLSYRFNEHGNISQTTSYTGDDEISRRWTYAHDQNKGRITEMVHQGTGDDPLFRNVDVYDKNGNRIEHLSYSQGDDDPYKETFKYDADGNLLEQIEYVNNGPLKTLYRHDDQGRLIEKSQRMGDQPMMTETFQYDDAGNLVSSRQEEGRTVHAQYVFEKKYEGGRETERTVYRDGERASRFVYSYNEHGHRAESREYDADNQLVSVEKIDHEYDDHGNWVKKIPSDQRGAPRYLLEREIEYFPQLGG